MTEWTIDWGLGTTETEPIDDERTLPEPEPSPHGDVVSGALIEDVQLDRAEWWSE